MLQTKIAVNHMYDATLC